MAQGKVLGCGIPTVYILPVGGGDPLAEVKASSLSWKRTLDEISDCRVQAAADQDSQCLTLLSTLEPFSYEISCYRDATEAWVGPLIEPAYTATELTIQARDLFQWFERRVLPFDRTFTATDLSIIAATYLDDALSLDPTPNISFSVVPCGVVGDRTVLGITYRRAADEVRELARGGLDFTTVGRRILFGGAEISSPRLPILTKEFFEITNLRLVGTQKANHVYVFGATPDGVTTPLVGEAGGDDVPLIQMTVQEPSIRDVPSATAAARTRWDFWRHAPIFITGRFLEDCPLDINDLIPGSIATIRQQVGFRYVDQDCRLVSVECAYDAGDSGLKETVRGVFEPVGTQSF